MWRATMRSCSGVPGSANRPSEGSGQFGAGSVRQLFALHPQDGLGRTTPLSLLRGDRPVSSCEEFAAQLRVPLYVEMVSAREAFRVDDLLGMHVDDAHRVVREELKPFVIADTGEE